MEEVVRRVMLAVGKGRKGEEAAVDERGRWDVERKEEQMYLK